MNQTLWGHTGRAFCGERRHTSLHPAYELLLAPAFRWYTGFASPLLAYYSIANDVLLR